MSHKGRLLVTSKFNKIVLLALVACGIWLRAPQLIRYPRFWAEEGSRYFHYALEHGFWSILFWVEPQAGYLDITRHFGAGLASLVPLVYAPYITTFISFSIQLLACLIIIYGNSPFFDNYIKKSLGCLIVLFAPSVIDEVWLNTINSMTWYGLIGFLIAADRLSSIRRQQVIFYRIVLTIGVLSGPYLCMLSPVYVLIAISERTRNTVINAAIVFVGLILQFLALLNTTSSGNLNEKRFLSIDFFDTTYAIFFNHIVKPIISPNVVVKLTQIPFGLTVVFGLFIVLALAIISYAYIRHLAIWKENWKILISWACFSGGVSLTSLSHQSAGRYAVLPGWLILFLLLNCSHYGRLRFISVVSICLLIFSLGIGLTNYSLSGRSHCSGHSWRIDIELARGGAQEAIPICPEGWSIVLPPTPEKK